ncbi:MAG: class I SAM-dependent methyltransferase, partial [Flammeovirgaceae bacterium]|nr:class I SAM-dependent methyltransferase [Flammeovirgaceae bacterium]
LQLVQGHAPRFAATHNGMGDFNSNVVMKVNPERDNRNEAIVAAAFNNQSSHFDDLYDSNYLVNYSRKIIRAELLRQIPANGEVLEINSGTGTDAVFLALMGIKVTATDISPNMVQAAEKKIKLHELENLVQVRQCSFWDIDKLDNKKYDVVYSNFGGLNCTDHLDQVLVKIINKLKPDGKAILVIMPVFCPWERIRLLFGNTKIGLRRRRGKSTKAHIEGEYFDVWYYNPTYLVKAVKGKARLVRLQSLSLFVPPSAYRNFDMKYPRLLSLLEKLDRILTTQWPFRNWGDYTILTLKKFS